MPPSPAAAPPRLFFLDWARILAFGLLVLYHVGMYYVSWDWHVKSPQAGPAAEPWMRLLSPWRMSLLFLISGAATACMLRQRGPSAGWLRERSARLLLPLVFGMLVIVPPQAYLEVVQQHGYAGGYLDFMRLYLAAEGDRFCRAGAGCLILPTWNHLWFLPYLAAYTLLLWLVLQQWPGLLDAGGRRLASGRAGWPAVCWLLLPALLLAVLRGTLAPRFPITHAFVDDPYAHLLYGGMFLLGALLTRAPLAWSRIAALRWLSLVLAVAGWALWTTGLLPPPGHDDAADAARAAGFGLQQWTALIAALGFAHRHLDHDGPLRRYLVDAVFPIYVLHQTAIVLFAVALQPAGLAPALEAPLLVGGTLACGVLGYEIARRLRWLRPWVGLKTTRAIPAASGRPGSHPPDGHQSG